MYQATKSTIDVPQGIDNAVEHALGASDDRSDNKYQEQNEHGKVHDRVTNDTSLAELRLLKRVDWWTNLATVDRLARAWYNRIDCNIPRT